MNNSICRNLCLDIRRGLRDKRFWAVLGIFSFLFFFCIVLDWVRPLTQYYNGGLQSYKYYPVPGHVARYEVEVLNGLVLFVDFFPFVGAAAFAWVIMDDRRQGYCMQQIQRMGFAAYYRGKLAASGILGGILGALCMVSLCLLSLVLIDYLPFFREAVDYNAETFRQIFQSGQHSNYGIGWSGCRDYVFLDEHPWVWNFLAGGIKYFVMGASYGLLAGIIAFGSDNRVLVYAGPVLALFLWDGLVYMFDRFTEPFSRAATVIDKFYLRGRMTEFGNLYHYCLLFFFFLVLVFLSGILRDRTECRYMEGGMKNG